MKKIIPTSIVALIISVSSGLAQEKNLNPADQDTSHSEGSIVLKKPLSLERADKSVNTVKFIDVVGHGTTPEEARKDAARLALQSITGTFIDARRRIELSISDKKTDEIVEEKILSYTNGYVNQFEVIKTEKSGGQYAVSARAGVSVAPLLKILQDNALPIVAFDAISAAATAETAGARKLNATKIYEDLVSRLDSVLVVGIGEPQVDTSLPSSHDETWIRIPVTFKTNEAIYNEWRAKYSVISDRSINFRLTKEILNRQAMKFDKCTYLSSLSFAPYNIGEPGKFFAHPLNHHVQQRTVACFASKSPENDFQLECHAKHFDVSDADNCRSDKSCIGISDRYKKDREKYKNPLGLNIKFMDSNNNVIQSFFEKFWTEFGFSDGQSSKSQTNGKRFFVDKCPVDQFNLFNYYGMSSGGDMILFSPINYATKLTAYALIKNDKIDKIASAKAEIVRSAPSQ